MALLVILPLAFVHGEYGGSDDQGTAAVVAARPGYQPWFHSLWTPPSPEIESLIFAAQAAFGAGIIGYVIGRIHGSTKARETEEKTPPADGAH